MPRPGTALLLLVALSLFTLLSPSRADEPPRFQYGATGYVTLDPAHVARPNDERFVLALYETLTAVDATSGEVVPAAAERWLEAADGRSWTFTLRANGRWSDGAPVKASDFVAAWRRALDPFEPSPWAALFRPIEGCAVVGDGDRAMRALSDASSALKDAIAENPSGIPGKVIQEVIERSAVRSYAEGLDEPNLKRMLRWGSDAFPVDKAESARAALREARRAAKDLVYDTYDALGTKTGFLAKDDRTLVVHCVGRCPYLPQLVARAPFAPLHPKTITGGPSAFDPRPFLSNGAYRLEGRGARPREGMPNPESAVHLKRDPDYRGPRPGHVEEILCFTDQGAPENLRRLKANEIQWLPDPSASLRKELESLPGWKARPAGRLVVLRLRADRPPFDNADARRAFALALDRTALAKTIWPTPEAATRLVPANAARVGQPGVDPKAAQAALAKAGFTGETVPWVELHYVDGQGLDDLADALAKSWDKVLGVEMGLRIDEPDVAPRVLAAGAYHAALGVTAGAFDDPAAWVLPFASDHPEGGLGWDDAGFAALIDAARDVDGFVAGGEAALAKLPEPDRMKGAFQAAGGGDAAARERLRRALLEAAEARLLDAWVVVPLFRTSFGAVEQGVTGLGSDRAWAHPAFFGDLRGARR